MVCSTANNLSQSPHVQEFCTCCIPSSSTFCGRRKSYYVSLLWRRSAGKCNLCKNMYIAKCVCLKMKTKYNFLNYKHAIHTGISVLYVEKLNSRDTLDISSVRFFDEQKLPEMRAAILDRSEIMVHTKVKGVVLPYWRDAI